MATYLELQSIAREGPMLDKIEVAVWLKAKAIVAEETPSATRLAWAIESLKSSRPAAEWLYRYLLAANAGITLAAIQSASDVSILANVSTAVDKFYP